MRLLHVGQGVALVDMDLDLAAGRIDALFAQQTALAATLAKPEFADYTIAGRAYINVQYVHGFIDEFGAGRAARPRRNSIDIREDPRVESRLGDYIVAGVDVKTLHDRLLLRLFGVLKVPSVDLETRLWDDYAPTGVLFPQIIWNVFDGTELMVGSFVMLGDRSTKFGDPAAGATEVFVRGKVSF